jgi:hypothetical protein
MYQSSLNLNLGLQRKEFCMNNDTLTVVISGSFRRHLRGIQGMICEFESLGVKVLSPALSDASNPGSEFVVLKSDTITDPKELELNHLHAIEQASVLYIYNPDGLIGNSTLMEMGYALGVRKQVFSYLEVDDVTLKFFCRVASPEEIARRFVS